MQHLQQLNSIVERSAWL